MKNIVEITKDLIEVTEKNGISINDFKYSDCDTNKNSFTLKKSITLSMTSENIELKNILSAIEKVANENELEISNVEYSETIIQRKINVKLTEI